MPVPQLKSGPEKDIDPNEICLFGQTNFRNQARRFGIKLDDRRRHMYIIGKTGMGKSTMMENMMLSDIYNGHGVGLIDPHGDFAEKIIDFIPQHRVKDVVYLNPADLKYPMGFNILEIKNEEQKHLVAAGMMGTFKKIWPDVWSARMEYILNNTLLALLDNPGTTLLGINRMMSDDKYRAKMVANVKDPVVKAFWVQEFASYSEKYAQEATASVQNKIGQFLSTSLIRNMVAQPKSTIDIRQIMDDGKILVMNLSKGRMGEDNSRLLGGMLITKIQLSAMERVDQLEHERTDFFLYVDEFQNFATPSFANILSEARKYHLSLIMAHQYVAQLDEVVADAVFGNVGTIVSFRVGAGDAEALAKEFAPVFTEEDIVNLGKFKILLKLMIDGVASQPFSSSTMPPIGSPTGSTEAVINYSRETYTRSRADIEEEVMEWSGLISTGASDLPEIKPKPGEPGSDYNLVGSVLVHKDDLRSRDSHGNLLPRDKDGQILSEAEMKKYFEKRNQERREREAKEREETGADKLVEENNEQAVDEGKEDNKQEDKRSDSVDEPKQQDSLPEKTEEKPKVEKQEPPEQPEPKKVDEAHVFGLDLVEESFAKRLEKLKETKELSSGNDFLIATPNREMLPRDESQIHVNEEKEQKYSKEEVASVPEETAVPEKKEPEEQPKKQEENNSKDSGADAEAQNKRKRKRRRRRKRKPDSDSSGGNQSQKSE